MARAVLKYSNFTPSSNHALCCFEKQLVFLNGMLKRMEKAEGVKEVHSVGLSVCRSVCLSVCLSLDLALAVYE